MICENHTDGCTTGAKCDNITKTCVCGGLYTQRPDAGFCQAPVGKVGGNCSTGNACSDANADCKDGFCLCKTGFTIEPSDASCRPCNSSDKCSTDVIPAPNVTCDPLSSRCQVAEGKAGGKCNTGNSCSDTNAECKDGLCSCKTGYKVKESDASCEESDEDSGIGREAGSVLCLVMAYVFSRLV
ncbi:cell death abnormality protein 1-like [Littorina saxatilis]|uniref:cell death abnormality protein 1-like n=1 Tax=Littorina saxatilis TaxID=31220 RepID=UPI0038B4D23B